jgi:hypothetical protein
MSTNDPALRGLWLAVIFVGSIVAATAGGAAFRAAGAPLPQALGAAFTVFVGVVTLSLAARRFLTE